MSKPCTVSEEPVLPPLKKPKLSAWQIFQKEFGHSEGIFLCWDVIKLNRLCQVDINPLPSITEADVIESNLIIFFLDMFTIKDDFSSKLGHSRSYVIMVMKATNSMQD